eukprot:jgi/Chrzof1/9428/Cz04g02210.t1
MAAHNDTSNSSHEAATDPGDNLYGAEGSGSTTSSSTSSRIARPHTTHATLPQEPHTTWPGDPDMPILRTRIVLELMHSADQKEKALTRHQLHQLAAQQHPELIKSINHLKKILNILKSRKLVATKPHDPAHPTVPPYLYYVTPQVVVEPPPAEPSLDAFGLSSSRRNQSSDDEATSPPLPMCQYQWSAAALLALCCCVLPDDWTLSWPTSHLRDLLSCV